MTIGDRIRERRKELGLSQLDLALRLGNKSRASVCTVEKNKEDLTTDRIRKYAEALETTPAYLMGWEDTEPEEYYVNPETADMAQKLFEDSNYRILFDAAKDSKPEDLLMAADLLKRLKGTNPDG